MGARRLAAGLVGLVVATAGSPVAAEEAPPAVRIAVVGDSMAHGSSGDWTWRYFLHQHLVAGGVAADFVGSRTGVHDLVEDDYDATTSPRGEDAYVDPDFDSDHQSRWGKSVTLSPTVVPELMAEHSPDVLVHALGFNDLTWLKVAPEALLASVRRQVDEARAANPSVRIVLAQAMVDVGYWSHYPVARYNQLLLETAPTWSTEQSPLTVATVPPGYRADGAPQERDTWDGVHPDTSGQVKIAGRVAAALAGVGVGPGPAPGLLVAPTEGLRFPSTLQADHPDADPTRARLTWRGPPGATGHDVWMSVDGGTWSEVAVGAPSGLVLTGLEPGVAHAFKVVARKHAVRSADDQFSPPVRVWTPTRPLPEPEPEPDPTQDPAPQPEPEPEPEPVPDASTLTLDNLRVAGGVRRVVASWSPVVDAVDYRIEWRRAGASGPWGSRLLPETSAVVTGLVAGARYDVRVTALTPTKVTAAQTRSVLVRGPRLARVSGLRASVERRRVDLVWRRVPQATHYRVERRVGGAWVELRSSVRRPRVAVRLPRGRHALRVRAAHQEWYAAPSRAARVRVR